jgi:hemerythrin superfamily protein
VHTLLRGRTIVNAIDLLEQQHREVEDLFEEFERAGDRAKKAKERVCQELSDQLAMHAEIEEKLFYPESKQENTEEILRESVEEHLAMKRILADLMDIGVDDEQFDAKVSVLKEQVEHHVEEEEKHLFPKVRKLLSKDELEDLGSRMQKMFERLEAEGDASARIPGQTDAPSQI